MKSTGQPDDGTLQEIIRRIVDIAAPERILLFGSAARGRMGRNSDLDLLVVKAGQFDQSRLLANVEAEGVYLEDLCFHAQQAAEKAIKALLIHRRVPFGPVGGKERNTQ